MSAIEYFFSLDGKNFIPLGGSLSDEGGKNNAENLLNSGKRKFPVPLLGETIFLAKRVMPERDEKMKNKAKRPVGRIEFLIAPLEITRSKKKIVLSIKGKFLPESGHSR